MGPYHSVLCHAGEIVSLLQIQSLHQSAQLLRSETKNKLLFVTYLDAWARVFIFGVHNNAILLNDTKVKDFVTSFFMVPAKQSAT